MTAAHAGGFGPPLTPEDIEPGHGYAYDPSHDGPNGERYCWCGWDEQSHARPKPPPLKLTQGRKEALACLMFGHRQMRPVTESNITTPVGRRDQMPLLVHWQAVNWLADNELVTTVWLDGDARYVTLTSAGIDYAEGVGL